MYTQLETCLCWNEKSPSDLTEASDRSRGAGSSIFIRVNLKYCGQLFLDVCDLLHCALVIDRDVEMHLRKFSELYVQLGVLEKLLRVAIPQSLGSDPNEVKDLSWLEKLPANQEGKKHLQKALVRQELENRSQTSSIIDFLPFSFWKYILHSRNFTTLWIPYTHAILVSTSETKVFSIFKEFESRLYIANRDRNFVAHYNTSLIKGLDKSLENVRWLQEAMGLVKAE